MQIPCENARGICKNARGVCQNPVKILGIFVKFLWDHWGFTLRLGHCKSPVQMLEKTMDIFSKKPVKH